MNIAMILAGGSGQRVGGQVPKQFIEVLGKPVLAYTLENFQDDPNIDAIEIVYRQDWLDECKRIVADYHIGKVRWYAAGGDTFQGSVMNGVRALEKAATCQDIVVISFGVSPLTTADIIDDSIRVCEAHGNGIAAEDIPLCTCIKDDEASSSAGIIREKLKGFSNPWTFRYGELSESYAEAQRRGILAGLEPHTTSVYFALGKRIWFSKSNGDNFKITTRADLEKFEGLLLLRERQRKEAARTRSENGCTKKKGEGATMISYKEFEVLRTLLKLGNIAGDTAEAVYRNVHYYAFKSAAEVAELLASLEGKRYVSGAAVTPLALREIEPLRVNNAIILAAGGSDISAKSVYSMPKGLFVKGGETLIERQIRQLKEAGVQDITVVIGYKQEMYFYLADKWGVTLEINPDFKKNNVYSLYIARAHLGSTYICNCDNYFEENPFSQYEYNAYHATVYKQNARDELLVRKNQSGRILQVYSGATGGECIYGHAYVDNEFSRRLVGYLNEEIDDFRVTPLFWEEFVGRHVDDLDMYVREYRDDFLFEFDTIQEIQNIDSLFLGNVSGRINQKICKVLHCHEDEIHDIVILDKGLTNILFTFVVRGERYIFRYPGDSSAFFIYRQNECVAQKLAAQAHADDTYVYIDESGVKISKYRENCKDLHGLYYHDVELMKAVARKIRAFHEAGYDLPDKERYDYDPLKECARLFKEASKMKGDLLTLFSKEWAMMARLKAYADRDGIRHTMCHNDINIDNILLTDTTLDIIDWEFAGYNDPGYDFGRVIAGLEYDVEEPKIKDILQAYFGRPATKKEHLHWMAYTAIHNWYYVGWALYKESINESSRDWMLFFFKQAKRIAAWCLPQYEAIYGPLGAQAVQLPGLVEASQAPEGPEPQKVARGGVQL